MERTLAWKLRDHGSGLRSVDFGYAFFFICKWGERWLLRFLPALIAHEFLFIKNKDHIYWTFISSTQRSLFTSVLNFHVIRVISCWSTFLFYIQSLFWTTCFIHHPFANGGLLLKLYTLPLKIPFSPKFSHPAGHIMK